MSCVSAFPAVFLNMDPNTAFLILLSIAAPFILGGILFIAGLVLFSRNRLAAGVCLLLAVAGVVLGCWNMWEMDREPRERRAWTQDRWTALVAADPESLRGSDLVDQDLELLRSTTRLKEVDLNYCYLTNGGLQIIAGLGHLESLSLQGALHSRGGPNTIAPIRGLTQLRELNISSNYLSDREMEHLRGLTQLRKLDVGITGITDAGLEHFVGMTELRELNLCCCNITDAGLGRLKPLRKLEVLSLEDVKTLTDAGFAQLSAFSSLQTLKLRGTAISDAGLAPLAKLKLLKKVDVADTKVTDVGAQELQQALPECIVSGYVPQGPISNKAP